MSKNQWALFLILIFLIFSCKKNKDKITTDSNAKLTFSQTEITFDTIFTSIGSITKRLWVFNDNLQGVNISAIYLSGGALSPYEIIIDGEPTSGINNFLLKGLDSMQILIRIEIDPNNIQTPFLVEDSIVFLTNGNVQDVQLVAFGQNAEFIIDSTLQCNSIWTNKKPYVLKGEIKVPPSCTLTIEKGAKILFHEGASLSVFGTLLVNGDKDSVVYFKQSNLSKAYNATPGQWKGIVFESGSKNNRISYADIQNAINGIIVKEEFDGDTIAELTVQNSKIGNCSSDVITLYNADIYLTNTLLTNAIGFILNIPFGGNAYFDYCTFTNYSYNFFRNSAIMKLSNAEASASNDLKAKFRNCIVWGDQSDEINTANSANSLFDITFSHSILKSTSSFPGINNNYNIDPQFENAYLKDFKLKSGSIAIDNGLLIPSISEDIEAKVRGSAPDIGCYEME